MNNSVAILDAIRRSEGGLSKRNIADATGIPWGTMFKLVNAMIKDDILTPGTTVSTLPGRPSIPLLLNRDARFFCGLDIGAVNTRIIFCDLGFQIVYSRSVPTRPYRDREHFCSWVQELYQESLEQSAVPVARLRGAGLAFSGNVDTENGILVSGGNFGMKFGENIPLSELEGRLELPVCSVTTMTAAAAAEYHLGEFAGCPNIVAVGLAVGIGSGVIANHHLLVSHPRRPVGYIGHILIPGNDRKCTCGFTGCLETYAGGEYLRHVAMEELPERPELHAAAALDQAAAAGDADAVRIMTKAASFNAAGIVSMVQLYSPDAIVFSGGQSRPDGFLYNATLGQIRRILPEERRDFKYAVTRLGNYQSALGAARLAYEQFLDL